MDKTITHTRLVAIDEFLTSLPDDMPRPYIDGFLDSVTFSFWYTDDIAIKVRDAARAIGGRWHKNDPSKSSSDAAYYILTHDVKLAGDVQVRIQCDRDEVCEKVETGTKTVVVPAKAAVEEHVEEQPVYSFICKPLNEAANALTLDDELAALEA